MPYILDISTAVPPHAVSKEDLMHFYAKALAGVDGDVNVKKLNLLNYKYKKQFYKEYYTI